MIAQLRGIVAEKLADVVIIDCGGVGYGTYVTTEDYGRLATGQEARLYVYEHIREQQHDLFGFVAQDTKQLFETLLGVNGIGPKVALNMLSIGSAGAVRAAIANGDVKFIQQTPGVGKKVAERVVVELKDKVGLAGVDLAATGLLYGSAAVASDEAAQALIALGYSPQDAERSLAPIATELSTEERVRQALRQGVRP